MWQFRRKQEKKRRRDKGNGSDIELIVEETIQGKQWNDVREEK